MVQQEKYVKDRSLCYHLQDDLVMKLLQREVLNPDSGLGPRTDTGEVPGTPTMFHLQRPSSLLMGKTGSALNLRLSLPLQVITT